MVHYGYNKIEYKAREYDFLAFNTEVVSDASVRKAINLIIDKDAIVASLGGGYASSNFSLDMGNWLYTEDLTVSVDTEEARRIMEEAGWTLRNNIWSKDGENLSITITVNANNSTRVTAAEAISETLNNFGIRATVSQVSSETYTDYLNNKNYECIITGIETSFSPSLHTFFGEGNIANYSNQEMLELISKSENTTDESELHECYKSIFSIYLEEAPYIGLYRNTETVVYSQSLVGSISPNCFNLYHNIELWYRQ